MKLNIEYICTIKTELEELESKHLVEINNNLIVFTFNKDNILKSINKDSEYFFSNCKHAKDMLNDIKNRNNLKLGLYDYYINYKLNDIDYINLYILHSRLNKSLEKYNNIKVNLSNLIK